MIWASFFPIVRKTRFEPVLSYVTFRGRQDVNWSCVDLEHLLSLYRWCTKEVIGLV